MRHENFCYTYMKLRKKIKKWPTRWLLVLAIVIISSLVMSENPELWRIHPLSFLSRVYQESYLKLKLSNGQLFGDYQVIGQPNSGIGQKGRVTGNDTGQETGFNNLPAWSFQNFPNYYTILGASQLDSNQMPEKGIIWYSPLDDSGRSQTVTGSLTFSQNVQPSYGVREQFTSEDNPSGWSGNQIVQIDWLNGRSYRGYFWNRSHQIGDALGGEARRENLVTGTRMQNVGGDTKGGMRYTERKAQDWLEKNQDGILYYQVVPYYEGDELIPRFSIVQLLSSDQSIDEAVLVYNKANGYNIDYMTGDISKEQ